MITGYTYQVGCHADKGKKLTYNRDNTVLLFSVNEIMTREKIIIYITALFIKNNKKCYFRYTRVSLHEEE